MQESGSDPYSLYLYSLRSLVTRERYTARLRLFFSFIGIEGPIEERCRVFVERGAKDNKWVMENVVRFFQYQRDRVDRKEIAGATVQNFVKCIKLFLEVNDIAIPWIKIKRGLPKGRRYAEDRAPTLEEIRKLIQYPDRRIKAIVLTAISSGIRLDAWDYLKWKDVEPIERSGEIIAAKLVIYRGEEEEYYSYLTPEAYTELKAWMDFRATAGENITRESWLMRDLWDSRIAEGRGVPSIPRRLKSSGVKRLLERALWTQNLRKKLPEGQRRHEFSASHSFRKYFHTMCHVSGMRPAVAEMLIGHSLGLGDSYFRPPQEEILQEYLKAVPYLTVSESEHIKRQLVEQEKKYQNDVQSLQQQVTLLQSQVSALVSEGLLARHAVSESSRPSQRGM